MIRPLNNLRAALSQVFAYPSYIALAGALATLAFLLAVWFPNLGLIGTVFSDSNAPLAAKLGIGCAACGSLILGAGLPFLGATGALAALPLKGEEFGILSVALLLVSLLLISKNIAEPIACPPASTRSGRQP